MSEIEIRAPLIAWPVNAVALIRRVDGLLATVWFGGVIGGGLDHLPIEVAERGSHRRPYFCCPGPDHRDPGRRFAKLYWPPGDKRGFACRDCHRLAYWTSQSRSRSPLHLARALAAAYWDDQARAALARARTGQRGAGPSASPGFSWLR